MICNYCNNSLKREKTYVAIDKGKVQKKLFFDKIANARLMSIEFEVTEFNFHFFPSDCWRRFHLSRFHLTGLGESDPLIWRNHNWTPSSLWRIRWWTKKIQGMPNSAAVKRSLLLLTRRCARGVGYQRKLAIVSRASRRSIASWRAWYCRLRTWRALLFFRDRGIIVWRDRNQILVGHHWRLRRWRILSVIIRRIRK